MKHEEPTYIRKGRTLRNVKDGTVETLPSISAAKKHSSLLQKANGGLGCGYVRVERKK